jgi:hypothetical protein
MNHIGTPFYIFECTRYHNIFKNTYWGQFKIKGNYPDIITPEHIASRDRFVEVNSIKSNIIDLKTIANFHSWLGAEADHFEAYRCKDKSVIIIISLYHQLPNRFEQMGFVLTPPLYATRTNTYLLLLDNLNAVKNILRKRR